MKEENKKTRKVKNIKRTSVVVIGTCKFDKRLLHFCLKPQTLLENLKKIVLPSAGWETSSSVGYGAKA